MKDENAKPGAHRRPRRVADIEGARSTKEQQHLIEAAGGTESAADRLRLQMLELIAQHDEDRAEARRKAEADFQAEQQVTNARQVATEYDHDRAADALTLEEVGRIRRAFKLAEKATLRVVLEANSDGRSATEIARELAMSGSYVARLLREHGRETHPEGR